MTLDGISPQSGEFVTYEFDCERDDIGLFEMRAEKLSDALL